MKTKLQTVCPSDSRLQMEPLFSVVQMIEQKLTAWPMHTWRWVGCIVHHLPHTRVHQIAPKDVSYSFILAPLFQLSSSNAQRSMLSFSLLPHFHNWPQLPLLVWWTRLASFESTRVHVQQMRKCAFQNLGGSSLQIYGSFMRVVALVYWMGKWHNSQRGPELNSADSK